ncbi:MAG: histidine kinase [Oscillospiraceae bacterium]|nr:histidine kinase [Oscillospiraceae bacterium]
MHTTKAVSATLMLAGIPMLFPALLPLLHRKYDRRRFLIAGSAVLHLIATVYAVSVYISDAAPETQPLGNLLFLLSFLIGLSGGVMLLAAVFCEPDGQIRFRNRTTPIPVPMLACTVLPVLLASTAQQLFPTIHLIEYGFSLSVFLASTCLRYEASTQMLHKEEVLELRQAKLLTEQIQPHFIFNVLMSIQNLCYQDADAAADCIAQFAGYLRGNMTALTADSLIPFETELEHIRQYVALEHACTDQPFTLDYQLDVTDFEIPALTVQPIVENAIKHGALSRRDGSGQAVLKTERIGQFVRITVTDNGTGSANLTERQKSHQSIGLNNVENRLAVQCGGSMTVSLSENGAKAVILIPEKEASSLADNYR